MRFLKRFNESISEEYRGLYVTPLVVDRAYCMLFGFYPKEFRQKITNICKIINDKYKDVIVIKMRRKAVPGIIISKEGNIQHVANDIYRLMNEGDYPIECRVVYGEGKMESITDDIHSSFGELVVKIGTYMDTLKGKVGIFKASHHTKEKYIKIYDPSKI